VLGCVLPAPGKKSVYLFAKYRHHQNSTPKISLVFIFSLLSLFRKLYCYNCAFVLLTFCASSDRPVLSYIADILASRQLQKPATQAHLGYLTGRAVRYTILFRLDGLAGEPGWLGPFHCFCKTHLDFSFLLGVFDWSVVVNRVKGYFFK
jgi:hypothetical protein